MYIETDAPYRLTKADDGSHHATKENLQLTVTKDCGDVALNHRVGQKPSAGQESRWLHANLKDHGIHLYVSGSHIVLTGVDRLPTFDLPTPESLTTEAMNRMVIEKDERGAYIIDTTTNRDVLKTLFEIVTEAEKNRLLQWAKLAIAKLTE